MNDLAWTVFAVAMIFGLPTFFGFYSYVIRTRQMAKKCRINFELSIDKIASQLRENKIEYETSFYFTSDMDCTPGSALCSRSSYTITANGNSFILGCYTKAPEIISVNTHSKNTNNDVLSKGLRGFESQGKLPHVLPEKILHQAAVFLAVPEPNSDSLSYENGFDSNDEIDVDMWEAMEILKGTDLHPNSHSQKVRVIGKTLR